MGLVHSGTGTHWAWYTFALVHYGTGTQWDWYTVALVHDGPGTQWAWYTIGLVHNRQIPKYVLSYGCKTGKGKILILS